MMLRTVDGSTYQRKLSAIASIREMADLFGDDLDDHLLRKMVIRILESLPGQMWEGKIKVFDALQHITKHCGSLINKDLDLRSTMIKGLLIEIQRKKMEYRIAGINGFGEMVVMDEFVSICRGIFAEYNTKEQWSINESTTNHSEQMENKAKYRKDKELLCCTVKCLGNLWNGDESMQQKYISFVIEEAFAFYLKRTNWMVQIAIFKSIQLMCVRLKIEVLSRNLMAELIGAIMEGFNDLKYAAVRHQALSALHEVLKLAKATKMEEDLVGTELMTAIKVKMDEMVRKHQKPIVVQQATKLRNDIFYGDVSIHSLIIDDKALIRYICK